MQIILNGGCCINKYGSSNSDSYVNFYINFLDTSSLVRSSANFASAHFSKFHLIQDTFKLEGWEELENGEKLVVFSFSILNIPNEPDSNTMSSFQLKIIMFWMLH